MKYFPIVWSALLRRPTETVFTWLAITAGFTLFASMIGLNVTYQRVIEGEREDRLWVVTRFFTTMGGLPIGLKERLKGMPGVSAVGAWASVCGHHEDEHHFACVLTVDDGMRDAYPFPVDSAQWNQLMSTLDGVLVSRKAAQSWKINVGDMFVVMVGAGIRADGASSWPFKVLAVVPDTPERPHGYIVGNIKYFQNNRPPQSQGVIAGFRLKLSAARQLNAVAQHIDHVFANSGTPTICMPAREEAANAYRSVVNTALLTRLVAAAGLFMILFLSANVIARAVDERIAEFGVLQAFGFTKRQLIGLVFAEAAIPCVLGAALGNAIAAIVTSLPARLVPSSLGVPDSTISALVFAASLGAAAVLALISAMLPLVRLWSRTPAELLAVD